MDKTDSQEKFDPGKTQQLFVTNPSGQKKDSNKKTADLRENLAEKQFFKQTESLNTNSKRISDPNIPPKDFSDRESKLPPFESRNIPSVNPENKDESFVEITVVHESSTSPRIETPCKTFEVWTRNRIYTTDDSLVCVEVTDRYSGKSEHTHPLLGCRLMGGQKKDSKEIELSYPLPKPGSEAIFQNQKAADNQFSRTSTVTRVILRLHVTTVSKKGVIPTLKKL